MQIWWTYLMHISCKYSNNREMILEFSRLMFVHCWTCVGVRVKEFEERVFQGSLVCLWLWICRAVTDFNERWR